MEFERVVPASGNQAVVGKRSGPAAQTLSFFDPASRHPLRVRPNPLSWDQVRRLRGARPAGPPPRPTTERVTVQRRASTSGVILVARQKIALGRAQAGRTITVHVAETTLTIETDGGPRTVTRTTTRPIRNLKANRPWSRKTSSWDGPVPTYRIELIARIGNYTSPYTATGPDVRGP